MGLLQISLLILRRWVSAKNKTIVFSPLYPLLAKACYARRGVYNHSDAIIPRETVGYRFRHHISNNGSA